MGKHSRSSLFLMELIIAILFFSLAGAVCIRLFVTAHSISQNTIARNHAITQTQNLAEAWLSAEGSQKLLAAALPGLEVSEKAGGTSFCLFFDKNWNPVPPPKRKTLHLRQNCTSPHLRMPIP